MAKSKITLYDSIKFNCLNRAGIRSPANTDNSFKMKSTKNLQLLEEQIRSTISPKFQNCKLASNSQTSL